MATTSKHIYILIAAIILGAITGGLASYELFMPEKRVVYINQKDTITNIDTIIKEISKTDIVFKTKAVIVKDTINKIDTVYTTRAFEAKLDTVAEKDTISISYFFPQDLFHVDIRRYPDEKRIITRTVEVEKIEVEKEAWYIKFLYGAAGAGVGAILVAINK